MIIDEWLWKKGFTASREKIIHSGLLRYKYIPVIVYEAARLESGIRIGRWVHHNSSTNSWANESSSTLAKTSIFPTCTDSGCGMTYIQRGILEGADSDTSWMMRLWDNDRRSDSLVDTPVGCDERWQICDLGVSYVGVKSNKKGMSWCTAHRAVISSSVCPNLTLREGVISVRRGIYCTIIKIYIRQNWGRGYTFWLSSTFLRGSEC